MEYIKASEYKTRIDVYFDGEKYVFVNAFHGLVAIARRDKGFPTFSSDGMTAYYYFRVEKARNTISASTIESVICKHESKYMPTPCKFIYDEKDGLILPYFVSIQLENNNTKRNKK